MKFNPRIAFVVQRCGSDIYGGAEQYILQLAKACGELDAKVQIFTSQCSSHMAWSNDLPSEEFLHIQGKTPIRIRRFATLIRRQRLAVGILRRIIIFTNKLPGCSRLTRIMESAFLIAQGPWCPSLWKSLNGELNEFDLVVCAGYLYATSVKTLETLASKINCTFIPMAHDEPEFRYSFVSQQLMSANQIAYLSQAERTIVEELWPLCRLKSYAMVPPGVSPSPNADEENAEQIEQVRLVLPKKYALYLGRINRHKGIQFLLENIPTDVPFVLAGTVDMSIPVRENTLILQQVSDHVREFLIRNATVFVIASKYESYSIVTADALARGVPVIALKGCKPIDELISLYGGVSAEPEEFSEWVLKAFRGTLPENYLPNPKLIALDRGWVRTATKLLEFTKQTF